MRLVPGPPGVGSVIVVTLVKVIIKYHDKALILPEFLFIKTFEEVELRQWIQIFFMYNLRPGVCIRWYSDDVMLLQAPRNVFWSGGLNS